MSVTDMAPPRPLRSDDNPTRKLARVNSSFSARDGAVWGGVGVELGRTDNSGVIFMR